MMKKTQKPPTNPDENSQSQDCQDQIKNLKDQLKFAHEQKIRALADYQNLQTRSEKEKFDFIKFANQKLLLSIIESKDIVDRAEIFVTDPGLKMVKSNLENLLKDYGVEEIITLDQEFDPITMECVDKNSCDNNLVVQVNRKGYKLYDKILRPAQVTVGKI